MTGGAAASRLAMPDSAMVAHMIQSNVRIWSNLRKTTNNFMDACCRDAS
jgi:hypothetical protein